MATDKDKIEFSIITIPREPLVKLQISLIHYYFPVSKMSRSSLCNRRVEVGKEYSMIHHFYNMVTIHAINQMQTGQVVKPTFILFEYWVISAWQVWKRTFLAWANRNITKISRIPSLNEL